MACMPGSCAPSTPKRCAEIWNSEQNAARDRLGTLMKFVPPVVVGGRVYLPNHDGGVPSMVRWRLISVFA